MKVVRAAIAVTSVCWSLAGSLPGPAYAQSNASGLSALSAMPIGSVLSGASAVVGSVVAIPALLLVSGAVLVVKTVEASAAGTVYLLERASDGARVSVVVAVAPLAALGSGAVVTVNPIGAGVILMNAGRVIAFVPNEAGRRLLQTERVSN